MKLTFTLLSVKQNQQQRQNFLIAFLTVSLLFLLGGANKI
jgi:hypothetical protein